MEGAEMAERKLLVLDAGGSAIKYGIFCAGELSNEGSVPTNGDDLDAFLASIREVVEAAGMIDGIAFSLPGIIDPESGFAKTGGAIRCLYGVNLREILEEEYGVAVAVMNDAKCAALAELGFGCLKDVDDAVVIVFGTGIGGALIVNGKLLLGSHLVSGEFSVIHDDVNHMAEPGNEFWAHCGIAGLSAAVERASGLKGLSGIEVFQKIREGNTDVEDGLREFCRMAAWHMYNLQVITDPQVFAIGGGISNEPLFIDYLREAIVDVGELIPQHFVEPKVVPCTYKGSANLVGAAYAFELQEGE